MKDNILTTKELYKTYDTGDQALNGVSMDVGGNEIVSIIGPSGAGKSTFIRCVNRLVEPTGGEVWLEDTEITALSKKELRKARTDMGMIFQEYNLVERLTVMENVLSGRLGQVSTWRGFRRDFPPEDVQRAYEVLDRVGLYDLVDNRADALSGGQRQRVGIARAIMQQPKILLVDEPTSSLDPETSHEVMRLLTEIANDDDIPVLINIHEIDLAEEYASRIVGLRDGEIVFEGEPEDLDEHAKDVIYRGAEPATVHDQTVETGDSTSSKSPDQPNLTGRH